jgi:hypothetical protein
MKGRGIWGNPGSLTEGYTPYILILVSVLCNYTTVLYGRVPKIGKSLRRNKYFWRDGSIKVRQAEKNAL